MFSLMFFVLALGVLFVFIHPINAFLQMMQQSDNLNCRGYVFNGDANNSLSFNATLNNGDSGDPLACLAVKPILAYLIVVFLVAGVSAVMGGRAADWFGVDSSQNTLPYQ